MRFYFVRHGATALGESNYYQVRETPLNDRGRLQARALARHLSQVPVDAILSSTMARARETAALLSRTLNLPVTEVVLLDEQLRPTEVRGQRKSDEGVKRVMCLIEKNERSIDWHFSDEENIHDLYSRASKALGFLLALQHEHVIVVTHGELLKMMLSITVAGGDFRPDTFQNFRDSFGISEVGLSVIDHESGGWYIQTWNDTCFVDPDCRKT